MALTASMSGEVTDFDKSSIYERHYEKLVALNQRIYREFFVTLGEIFFIGSFLLNFILGKIVHKLSSQEDVNNYWNNKRNIVNQLFVKKGWLWTTIVLVAFYTIIAIKKKKTERVNYAGVVIRYIVATVWWVLFTQWCFGFPIMDKIFLWSGGYCIVDPDHPNLGKFVHLFSEDNRNLFSSSSISSFACRRLKGKWEGGHDPSGHVFLMVHSSLYLFFEVKQYWKTWRYYVAEIEKRINAYTTSKDYSQLIGILLDTPHLVVTGLIALWWFMLLMTNIYFHSLFEKFVGLLFGYVGVLVIYYLPRWLKS